MGSLLVDVVLEVCTQSSIQNTQMNHSLRYPLFYYLVLVIYSSDMSVFDRVRAGADSLTLNQYFGLE